MFNFDYITKEGIIQNGQKSLTICIDINNWRFWIWKNKCITEPNKS